ncbi:MAG: methylated-DNA--[protein]-cysteine S-methyltransferase, partial [Proteobacteria bacterium]
MKDLEFYVYRVPSENGDWLAAFESDELIFLSSYNPGKKIVEQDLETFLHRHYNFHLGKFETA